MKLLWKMEHLLLRSKCSIFQSIFKNLIFQRRPKALVWSKGLSLMSISSKPRCIILNSHNFDAWKPLNEYPYEIPYDTAFHQGLHCLLRQIDLQRKKYNIFLEKKPFAPSIYNADFILCSFMENSIGQKRVKTA